MLPSANSAVTLAKFVSGSSEELGVSTGEASFPPVAHLQQDGETVLILDRYNGASEFISDIQKRGSCQERGEDVDDLIVTVGDVDGETTLVSGQGGVATVSGRRWWVEVLDAFQVSATPVVTLFAAPCSE